MSAKRQAKRNGAGTADLPAVNLPGDEQLRQEIELRAYYRFCQRGCTPGREVEDWLAAEEEVLASRRSANAAASR